MRATQYDERGPTMFLQRSWSALSNNPAVVACTLLAGFVGVMTWAWWWVP